ncbi:hypothetical protein M8J77_006099 [Diaphorina citri]|nr:hypothetical protein M8J77_006099 [Diaphorina citri]
MPKFMNPIELTLFADDTSDTTIFIESDSMNNAITQTNTAISKVELWLKANGLVNNQDKTAGMLFSCGRDLGNVASDFDWGHPLDFVPHTKFLGITIDQNLN